MGDMDIRHVARFVCLIVDCDGDGNMLQEDQELPCVCRMKGWGRDRAYRRADYCAKIEHKCFFFLHIEQNLNKMCKSYIITL